jgi:hypothetical protein
MLNVLITCHLPDITTATEIMSTKIQVHSPRWKSQMFRHNQCNGMTHV